jgi:NAD(P)-dependent dehydrogenase (short-subunit alcohol dehydrogenase family)
MMTSGAPRTFATYPELAGRVVFISGGGSGIGFELARGFASNGCKVVLVDINEDSLVSAAASLRGEYPDAALATFRASVTEEVELAEAVAFAITEFGAEPTHVHVDRSGPPEIVITPHV